MSRKHPTGKELKDRLKHFPKTLPLELVRRKLEGKINPDTKSVQDIVVELSKEYLEQLRLTHNARGACHQTGCFFNPETHKEVSDGKADVRT